MAQRDYEALVILNPNVGEEEVAAATQRVADQITGRGAQLENVDSWGRRRMYYPIKHQRDGQYVVYAFRAEPQAVAELEASWRITEDVLRHLVTRREEYKLPRRTPRAPRQAGQGAPNDQAGAGGQPTP